MTPLAAPQRWSTQRAVRTVHGRDRGGRRSNWAGWSDSWLRSGIDSVRVAFDFGSITRPPGSGDSLASAPVLLP